MSWSQNWEYTAGHLWCLFSLPEATGENSSHPSLCARLQRGPVCPADLQLLLHHHWQHLHFFLLEDVSRLFELLFNSKQTTGWRLKLASVMQGAGLWEEYSLITSPICLDPLFSNSARTLLSKASEARRKKNSFTFSPKAEQTDRGLRLKSRSRVMLVRLHHPTSVPNSPVSEDTAQYSALICCASFSASCSSWEYWAGDWGRKAKLTSDPTLVGNFLKSQRDT